MMNINFLDLSNIDFAEFQIFDNLFYEIIIRLVFSFIVGFIIGFEREWHGHHAGLKTHILVCVAAALTMIVSKYGFSEGDPARLAAQVIPGVGFIGAGTIMQDRKSGGIKGLTTAATLWITAMIGLAVGNGFYLGVLVSLVLVTIALVFIRKLEISLGFKDNIIIINVRKNFNTTDLFNILFDMNIENYEFKVSPHNDSLVISLSFKVLKTSLLSVLIEEIRNKLDIIDITVVK